ncbi:hypothetical protein BH11MYX3_BH11MYX3_35690 [soil metagenome]
MDGFRGSNLQVDLGGAMPHQATQGTMPTAGQLPANTHFTIYGVQTADDRARLFELQKFEVHPIVDVKSPCYIDVGTHVPHPGLHVSKFLDVVAIDTGIPDYRNSPSGATEDQKTDAATAAQRMNNIALLGAETGIKAVTSASASTYPAVAPSCASVPGMIPPPMCTDDESNKHRLEVCQKAWQDDPTLWEGTDRVLVAPLAGTTFGLVDGMNPINLAPVGGAQFFIAEAVGEMDAYAIYYQTDGMDSQPGSLLLYGTPTYPTRGIAHVHLTSAVNPQLTAEMAIFVDLGKDDTHFSEGHMHTRWILISAVLAASQGGCKSIDCGEGTVERDGNCEPANETVTKAECGPFTMLQGDKCVPMFPPTECDPGSTTPDVDPATGVTTCVGTGTTGGCDAAFACPAPATGKQTICGQIYDFEDNMKFAAAGATGAQCTAVTPDGPCALKITAYDAIQFGTNPATAPPLNTGPLYIDDCGRYRVPDISVPAGPFIGLGIDDSVGAMGPNGITNTVGVAIPKSPNMATRDFEAWIVKKSTTDKWVASGGPPLSGGYYVNIFRGHRTGTDTVAGVQSTRSGNPNPTNDYYFTPAQTTRETVLTSATVTGVNGSALITNASVLENPVYSGTGGIPAECAWETHAGASIPNIVFIQLFRPQNAVAQTCPL